MALIGTLKIEVEESVTGDNYVENAVDLVAGKVAGITLVTYTPKVGITKARFKVTEEGVAAVKFSIVAGIK